MEINILIVGVGGQGTLLASRVLGEFAAGRGLDCKLSEVHGMAQRGGSVVTHVKIAGKVFSPIVAEGTADIILAFEKLEALRSAHFLKPGGMMIVNVQKILPMPVITGAQKYPEKIITSLASSGKKVIPIDALSIAEKCGSIKAANTVMIGRMAAIMNVPLEEMKEVVARVVPEKFKEINLKAVEAGYKEV
jgi:indolepyruvate ferredoxin oxidoreductase beta subunit